MTTSSNAGTELSLRLPKEAVATFPTLLEELEARMPALGLQSYGIETSTLEEVQKATLAGFVIGFITLLQLISLFHSSSLTFLKGGMEERERHKERLPH